MEPILRMLDPRQYRGVLTPLFDFGRSRMQPFLKATPPRDPSLLMDIQSLIHRNCTDASLVPIYDDMIEQLRRILGLMLTPARSGSTGSGEGSPGCSQLPQQQAPPPVVTHLEAWDLLIWQWTQGKDFLPLLEAVPPPQEALVIFAYCLLVLRKLENKWWIEGWADHLMGRTWALLDDQHRHWVGWATEEMGWIPPR